MTNTAGRKKARRALEERLGHRFRNQALLEKALTHSSVAGGQAGRRDNQRLEFLGDRVLGVIIADYLFHELDSESEGRLSRRYAAAVENARLAAIARETGIGAALEVQPHTDLASQDKVLADALEAVIGAVWCDGGGEAAREVVLAIWGEALTGSSKKDSKSLLQEYALRHGMSPPHYEVVKRHGPDHDVEFTITVTLGGQQGDASAPEQSVSLSATGSGASKRIAQQEAASILLERLK